MNPTIHFTPNLSNRITPLKGVNVLLIRDEKISKREQVNNCEKALKRFGAVVNKNYCKIELSLHNPVRYSSWKGLFRCFFKSERRGYAKRHHEEELYSCHFNWLAPSLW